MDGFFYMILYGDDKIADYHIYLNEDDAYEVMGDKYKDCDVYVASIPPMVL